MKSVFRAQLESLIPLEEDHWKELELRLELRTLKKGDVLQEAGKASLSMNYVVSGAIRSYLYLEGNEITWNFYFPGGIATDFQSFISEETTPLTFLSIDQSMVISLPKDQVAELYRKVPALMQLETLFAKRAFLDMRQRMESFLLQSAEERYVSLIEKNPALVRKIPNKDIATYLGIAPQSLSRIKRRLFKSKK
ncbi:MAG: Crp/Fnr family transcriptional regulator [Flavobacteriales bacterium]|nr:Crp/Fnr family transcriptional regulator [Flavobacteriales bacterium]